MKSDKISLTEKGLPPFKCSFDFASKLFLCDPRLPTFLGYKDDQKLSITQLFSAIDSRQVASIKKAFQEVLAKKVNSSNPVILNGATKRLYDRNE